MNTKPNRDITADTKAEGEKCPDCQKTFKSKGGLTLHMNAMHLTLSPSQLEQAKRHIAKEPRCPECSGRLFRDEHPDGYIASPYCCEDCEYTDRVSELDDIQEDTDSLEEKFGKLL